MSANPFLESTSSPGHGQITIATLPPSTPTIEELTYQYPLKLVSPDATSLSSTDGSGNCAIVHTVFLLTYGGGLVAGDSIDLHISLTSTSRLVLLTQGSTKIFKTTSREVVSRQSLIVDLEPGASLCYLPDPVQPFGESTFEQKQVYNIKHKNTNLCICDWVCEGRPARGENWSFLHYASRNEIFAILPGPTDDVQRLLLRDNLEMENGGSMPFSVPDQMHGMGLYGTLILGGPMFRLLGQYFLDEFKLLPRIGARQWDLDEDKHVSLEQARRTTRITREKEGGLIWTASANRGYVVVKFASKHVEGGKRWLNCMLREEGTVETHFGEGSLLCLR
ncbi:MAG: hypothetical protein M1828_000175 [Chrysothrix sp. TS-e1954]|nr:MAG: hypothetical protein M1828_000175 [Chrysothrix sp. TS-e1954]